MQIQNNYHRYLWLLSGTGEGPYIAKAFLMKGWKVSVSVVTTQAAQAYEGLDLSHLWIGALDGTAEIEEVLKNWPDKSKQFDLVLDATHPFASQITADLYKVCIKQNQKILRFDRPLIQPSWANYISDLGELSKESLVGKRFLFAIGSRSLFKGVLAVKQAGANAFARILPSPQSIKDALSSKISSENISILRPLTGLNIGEYEAALCRKWSITSVVCRQSGGLTQKIWQSVCKENKIDLWLISRPAKIRGLKSISNIEEIFMQI